MESDFVTCKQWCDNVNYCGGFVINKNGCYFKNLACKNNLVNVEGASTFLKQKGEISLRLYQSTKEKK